jgi:ferredoxin
MHPYRKHAVDSVIEQRDSAKSFYRRPIPAEPSQRFLRNLQNACLAACTYREICILYTVRHSRSQSFKAYLQQAAREHETIHLSVLYSQPPTAAAEAASGNALAGESEIVVDFRRSGRVLPWDAGAESLLTFALENDVPISAGCRYGDCGTCLTPLLSGAVAYEHPTGVDPDPGSCLPCSCKPITSIVLDA